jgi:glycosyltransferase involved in cell wall biosynthesis
LTLIQGNASTGTSKKFLAVGRFSPLHKGFDLLIQAFALFARNNNEWTLDIVGVGEEEKSFRNLITKLHLDERISIYPFTNNIQRYYSEAQVYILSSRWEGMPLVLMEAMSHGLPIVSSDLPVCKEIMGDFAIYFKNGNINDLARSLKDATEIDWEKKSKEALTIAKRFDITTISNQWRKLIDE